MFDKVFEKFNIGERWRSPRGRTITEADIVNFCGVSGDFFLFIVTRFGLKKALLA